MSIKYYPLNRIKTGLYTRGTAYALDGKPYTGAYYLTYKGDAYTGTNPTFGGNEPLSPIPFGRSIETVPYSRFGLMSEGGNPTAMERSLVKVLTTAGALKQLAPYTPLVLDSDYTRGYFTRYFIKRIADKGYVREVSYSDWASVRNGNDPTYEEYEAIDMLWQLTGPLHDTRVSQYQVNGGVYDTNKRVTEAKSKGFIGLMEFIGEEYTKFAKITVPTVG